MDTKQLQTFVTLSNTLNYQRAADQLQYAPSSLFKHIQLLEEELGATLFVKKGRQLELTKEGRRFLPEAEHLLGEWKEIVHGVSQTEQARTLSIGGCELNISYSLRNLLQRFISAYPDVRFNITTSPNADAPELLEKGQTDLCFYFSFTPKILRGFQGVVLYHEPVYPSVFREHPLMDRESVSWEDLAAYPVMHSHDSCLFYRGYAERLQEKGLKPLHAAFLGNISLVAKQAQKENGIMLVSYHALKSMQDDFGLVPLPLTGEPLGFWESILYHQDAAPDPSMRRMIRMAVSYANAQIASHPDILYGPPDTGLDSIGIIR